MQAADTVRSNPAHLSPCLSRGEKEIVNLVDEDVAKDCRKKNKVIKLDPRHNKGIMDDVTGTALIWMLDVTIQLLRFIAYFHFLA